MKSVATIFLVLVAVAAADYRTGRSGGYTKYSGRWNNLPLYRFDGGYNNGFYDTLGRGYYNGFYGNLGRGYYNGFYGNLGRGYYNGFYGNLGRGYYNGFYGDNDVFDNDYFGDFDGYDNGILNYDDGYYRELFGSSFLYGRPNYYNARYSSNLFYPGYGNVYSSGLEFGAPWRRHSLYRPSRFFTGKKSIKKVY